MSSPSSFGIVFKFLTSLVSAAAVWLGINLLLFQVILPILPGRSKSIGTPPTGFLILFFALFSIYFSAKLGGYVWKRLS